MRWEKTDGALIKKWYDRKNILSTEIKDAFYVVDTRARAHEDEADS